MVKEWLIVVKEWLVMVTWWFRDGSGVVDDDECWVMVVGWWLMMICEG